MPVGNLSRRDGGHLNPHRSHQSGRDVDIGFILKKPPKKGIFINTTPKGLHLYKQWVVLKCFLDNPDTKMIIMERSIVGAMKRYIKRIYKTRKTKLNKYLKFFPGRRKAVIIADNDHRSHMHIRMKCAEDDKRCRG